MTFTHLSAQKDIQGGKMCIKGTRISVDVLLEWLADGTTQEEITALYPLVTKEAIAEALRYASMLSRNEILLEDVAAR